MTIKILVFCLISTCAFAGDIGFRVGSIVETSEGRWIAVDRKWRQDCPKRLEVKLHVNNDVPSKDLIIKAYFYDANKKLVHTYAKPCKIWEKGDDNYEMIGLPEVLKKNSITEVYFAITPELYKKFPKAVLIVFGDNSTLVVKAKNELNPMDYEFPEKSRIAALKK